MRKAFIILFILVLLILAFFCFLETAKFPLKTTFPDHPNTLSFYEVIGGTGGEFGELKEGFISEGPPTREDAILIAENYLLSHDLLPADAVLESAELDVVQKINMSNGEVVQEYPLGFSISYSREINGLPVIGFEDTLWVYIAQNNEVVYCVKTWKNLSLAGEVNIINPKEAYDKLLNGKVVGKPFRIEPFEIYNISLGYYANPTNYQNYYYPVWIFYGNPDTRRYYAVYATE